MPFYDFDSDLIGKEKKRIAEKQGQSPIFWKPIDGRNLIRFLPSCDEKVRQFWKRVLVHFDMRDEEGRFTEYVCPRTHDSKSVCPICTHVNQLYRTGNEEDREVAGKIRPTIRYYYNIHEVKQGVQPRIWVWKAPMTFHEKKLILQLTEYGNITDVKNGLNMVVTRIKGENGIPSYELIPKSEKVPVDSEILKLMQQPNITDLNSERAEKGQGMYDLTVASASISYDELKEALSRRLVADSKISAPNERTEKPASTPSQSSPPSVAKPTEVRVEPKPASVDPSDYGQSLDDFEKSLKV